MAFNSPSSLSPWRFCIAPMMDWSDRHCRYFWRLLTQHSLLYTEMVTSGALIHGNKTHLLNFNPEEHPLALQVGGSHPAELAECAKMAEDWGYDEINLNCGCPSDRVQSGKIGAILMTDPSLVANCVEAMTRACNIPVTVKHRIGVDNMEDYRDMRTFVATVANAGCNTFIVHARKAWLKGLSPKENREIPPLKYELVYELKDEFPTLTVVINGGITTIEQSHTLLKHVDGVMIGREAYQNPYFLRHVDSQVLEAGASEPDRKTILMRYAAYCEKQLAGGHKLHFMSRHALGLYQGQPGARNFRRHITENANKPGAGVEVLYKALTYVEEV